MHRLLLTTAALVTLALTANSGLAQSAPQRTLADRFGELRQGWSFSSDQPAVEEPTPPAPQSPQAAAAPVAVSDTPAPFPRVNPRELLPREWFGVGVEEVRARKQATAPVEPSAAPDEGDLGSARARLLRDLRRPNTNPTAAPGAEPRVASRATARAGSVLSPGAPSPLAAPSAPTSASPALSKSIAEEVAQAMQAPGAASQAIPSQAAPAAEPTFAAGPTPAEPAPMVEESAEPIVASADESGSALPFGYDDLPFDESAAPEGQVTESDSASVRVAANPTKPTKLPLFIGDRYSTTDQSVSVAPADETDAPSPAAAEAFAAASKGTAAAKSAGPFATESDDDYLLTQSLPVLVSRVGGPRTIVVGREATYRVLLANRGDVAADGVVTKVRIPEWADVVGAEAAEGAIDPSDSMASAGEIVWRVDHLAAGQMTELDLRLVATAGKPIELAVTHTHRPIDGAATVEVQEPKLALAMSGPSEVDYGRPQTFRLTISNPGTGTAEKVQLTLTPPGSETDRQTTHELGSIAAGAEREVEIELTAREAGQLAINASASAVGDVTADVSKPVFCRKAELVVDWRGPSERYAGAPAVYYFRVRNPGTAPAPEVVLSVELPQGFEPNEGAATPAIENGKLAYRVGSLKPGEDRYFELRGLMRTAGENTFTLRATAADETRSERVDALTQVVALADLKLDVVDPRGPIATGQEAEYKIRVTNRGTSDAHEVKIVGLFSEGIEPHHTEGAECSINDGRVAFKTIDRLPVGESKELIIHARAHTAGSHLFRAEVVCRDLDIKLAAEETTRFFEDTAIDVAGEGYPSSHLGGRYPR